jgi:hypothetical protein
MNDIYADLFLISILQHEVDKLAAQLQRMSIIYHKSGYHKCIPKSHPHLWIMKSKKSKTGDQLGILI